VASRIFAILFFFGFDFEISVFSECVRDNKLGISAAGASSTASMTIFMWIGGRGEAHGVSSLFWLPMTGEDSRSSAT